MPAYDSFDVVIVVATDMQGRLFGRSLQRNAFQTIIDRGIAVSSCALAWDISQSANMQVDYSGFQTGWQDLRLVPAMNTLRPSPWDPSTAIVMADARETDSDSLVNVAPRTILIREVEALAKLGVTARIGTELEFYLFSLSYGEARRREFRRLDTATTGRAQDLITHQTNQLNPFFRRLDQCLQSARIDACLGQSEWGVGQWEVTLDHQDPLEVADRHTILKTAVRAVATELGMSATFMAKPCIDDAGSSCHVNVSLYAPGGSPRFFDGAEPRNISSTMRCSIGGLLACAPDVMLWYAPTVNSYRRTASKLFAGHGRTWGIDNRTVSCRVNGNDPASMRIEFRVPGADANVYLVLAAVLASIRQGLRDGIDPGPMTSGNAYDHDVEPLPEDLPSAAMRFENSPFAIATFGQPVVTHYVRLARFEWSQFVSSLTDWELSRYFEAI